MILLNIQFPCPDCSDHPDSQPNFCRKCRGSGHLPATVSAHQLSRMPHIPEMVSAVVTLCPRRRQSRQKARAAA